MNNYKIKPFGSICFLTIFIGWSIFILNDSLVKTLAKEDGFVEYIGAVCWLLAAIICFIVFYINRKPTLMTGNYRIGNLCYLLLGVLLLFAAGEEISWGQRLLGFSTPEIILNVNRQSEFNIHNIWLFHGMDSENKSKTGFMRWITIERLFALFWFGFCLVLPIIVNTVEAVRKYVKKYDVPVPPLCIGIFFLGNHLIYKILEHLLRDKPDMIWPAVEVKETIFAILFLILILYFFTDSVSKYKLAIPQHQIEQ